MTSESTFLLLIVLEEYNTQGDLLISTQKQETTTYEQVQFPISIGVQRKFNISSRKYNIHRDNAFVTSQNYTSTTMVSISHQNRHPNYENY